MNETTRANSPCPVARTVELLGDKWSLLIVRDAFAGVRRFGQFQRSLGVAKNILSMRLRTLTDAGVLRSEPASDGSSYREYVLTDKGRELFDLILSLRQWGEHHGVDRGEEYAPLIDHSTGEPLARLTYVRPDGSAVRADDTHVGALRPMS
ncbi:helix-turn-helix transcriptional regulator (plasmid) [Embleya sp. NBC_00888]|uniref:winged helix-turn-helix transcriptional regulator n=1 Tax=Embleya sp. NBC_00888 TaxID=2975960 RepID=UPI002F913E27|nr:helix-turn-helix transcriptional regulator [Embleya sp. NBC_00888]